jgi:type IV secretion system protein VirD4
VAEPAARWDADPLQALVLVVLALGAGLSLLVLLVGEIAGRLLGTGSPGVGLAEATEILGRLPSTWHEPRQAWPEAGRHELPGAAGMYAVTAVLAVAAVTPAAFVLRRRLHRAGRGGFARAEDVRDLAVREVSRGRIALGYAGRRLLATQAEHSVLVLGATRSGKTRGFAVPTVLGWDGPAVVLSSKTDLLHMTRPERERRGPTWVFDPTSTAGVQGHGWSPLSHATTWAGAVRTANAMSRTSGTTAGLGGAGKHWERVAAQLIAPLLLAAATGARGMSDVVRWVMTKDLREPGELLAVLGDEAAIAVRSLTAYLELEPRARDSAFSTARTVLDVYEDPGVAAATADWDIAPAQLLDGGARTLYLVGGSAEQTRLAPLFLALLEELLREAYEAAARRRAAGLQRPERPLLLLLDEAANIAPLPQLATLASSGGGEGIQLVTIFQDLSQVRHRYGTEWGSVVSNHVAKVLLAGVTDPETLQYFSSTIGDAEAESTSLTVGADGRRSRSTSSTFRPVLAPRALRELEPGTGVCLYGHRPPVRLRLSPLR